MAVNRSFTDNYVIAGGELYIKLPEETNFRFFGQTEDAKLKVSKEYIEHKNSESNILATDLKLPKTAKVELDFSTSDLNKEMLALAFAGEYTEITETGGSVSDEDLGTVKSLYIYNLAHKKVSNVVVKYKDGDNNETAIENVDYSVDEVFGSIEISNNGVLDGKDVKVDYNYANNIVTEITALNDMSKVVALMFRTKNQHGEPAEYLLHKVQLSMNGDYDLKSLNDALKIQFNGEVLKDGTKPEGQQFMFVKRVK